MCLLFFLVFWPSPLFFPVSHCFRGRSKKNLKVYVIINCLNNKLITHFVWYLEKEITRDIGTLSIDREIRNIFMNNSHRKWNQKLGPDSILCLITQNNHFMQGVLIKIRYFKIRLSKSFKKYNFIFPFKTSPFYWTMLSKTKRVWN